MIRVCIIVACTIAAGVIMYLGEHTRVEVREVEVPVSVEVPTDAVCTQLPLHLVPGVLVDLYEGRYSHVFWANIIRTKGLPPELKPTLDSLAFQEWVITLYDDRIAVVEAVRDACASVQVGGE